MDRQRNSIMRKSERGVALLVVLFALVLLSVIGLGMMYSTNMETDINHNYREKQVSMYAAIAGVQEARERIKYPFNITPPTSLPDVNFPNVIYIVSDASVVKPWLPGNRYFDTELCQENVMGLTGTFGVPCTTVPTGSAWYQVVDNSQSSSAPWNLTHPLDWKWTRIQLKGNNSTPVPVNGDATDDAQACWNGANQMSTPTGYTAGCQPAGRVKSIAVQNKGSGYTSLPTVTLTGGGGSGAAATAVLAPEESGYVASVAVDVGGNYVSPPTVAFSSGNATATAVLSTISSATTTSGAVTSITTDAGGAGYTTPPTVTLVGGGGSGATATAVLSTVGTTTTTGYVNAITATTPGSDYTSPPTVTITGGGGSDAAATAVLAPAGRIKTVNLSSAGSQCYSAASDAVVSFSGGGGSGATAVAVLESTKSCVYSVSVPITPHCSGRLDSTNNYSPEDQRSGVTFAASGQNKSASGTLFVSTGNHKAPSSFSIQNSGNDPSGYSANTFTSQLELSTGAWAECGNITVTATTGYRIASINVTNSGSGYTSDPTVMITGGVGSIANPSATVTRGFPVTGYTITNGGTGYTSSPTVTLSGGGGTGATAAASIMNQTTTVYPVNSFTVTSGGAGYTSAPAVVLSGGGGAGAAGTANIAIVNVTTYPIASITVNAGGSGYDAANPPTVSFSGGGGSGGAATATVTGAATGNYVVDHIDVDAEGVLYTSNPTVTITGGGGTGATALAQVSGGTKYGKVWLLTSLAETRTGARTMVQLEVASPVLGFAPGGALTLDGPNPIIDAMPNSNLFTVKGEDANTCSEDQAPTVPAIMGFDDPDANPPTVSVETIIDSLPRPDHYTGSGGTPSVQNGFASLGETMGTPAGMDALMSAIYNTPGANHWNSTNVGSFDPTATTNHSINYVDGDVELAGTGTGRGILVVTGTLILSGDFNWFGIIYVVGEGHVEMNGGGNGYITGSIWVAKIWDNNTNKNLLAEMGQPTFNWNGGGNNGVRYDHCYVDNLMTAVPQDEFYSTSSLKVLSFRVLPY